MPVMEHLRRPKTLPQLKKEQQQNKKQEERQLDIIAGAFGGGCAILSLWVFVVVFLN